MMEPLRNEYAPPNSPLEPEPPREKSPLDAQSIDEILARFPSERELPLASDSARSFRPQNPRLNRTAENIGAALGTTVGRMRNGLSLVQSRQREITREVSDRPAQQAQAFTATAVEKVEELGDVVEEKASEFADFAQQGLGQIRRQARERITELRRQAVQLREERPLELIAAFAGAAFVIGVTLRLWRANND